MNRSQTRRIVGVLGGMLLAGWLVHEGWSASGVAPESRPPLSPVQIADVRSEPGGALVHLTASPDTFSPAIRVDPSGNGDVVSVADALRRIDRGTIALAAGTHLVEPSIIPANVQLIGGYDPQTWAFAPQTNMTVLERRDALDDRPVLTLLGGATLGAVTIRSAGTGISLAGDGAAVIGVGVLRCDVGIHARAETRATLSYLTVLDNRIGILAHRSSEVALQNSVVSHNVVGLLKE